MYTSTNYKHVVFLLSTGRFTEGSEREACAQTKVTRSGTGASPGPHFMTLETWP
jgi:hypothetical protein